MSADSGGGAPEVGHLPPLPAYASARPSRPIGVGILAFLIALIGILILLAGSLFLVQYYTGDLLPNDLLIVHSVSAIGAALLVLLGAVLIALATALWRQEVWALYTTVGVSFAGLAFLFFTNSITYLFLVLLVVFVYLLIVRRHFY